MGDSAVEQTVSHKLIQIINSTYFVKDIEDPSGLPIRG